MNVITKSLLLAVLAMGLITADSAKAALTPVLLYDADATSSTVGNLPAGTAIADQSGAGNNGTVGAGVASFNSGLGAGVDVVEDDPFSVAGQFSFSFPGGGERINTDAADLLTDTLIAAAGGYTMESWVKTSSTGGTFLSFAGTEGLSFETVDGQLRSRHHRGGDIFNIGDPGAFNDGEWHHIRFLFDTSADLDGTAGSDDLIGNLVGEVTAIVDGTAFALGSVGIGTFGDTLDRSISVGGHPQGFGGLEFEGLLYNPSVSLGVPEPTSMLLAFGALATMAIGRKR